MMAAIPITKCYFIQSSIFSPDIWLKCLVLCVTAVSGSCFVDIVDNLVS